MVGSYGSLGGMTEYTLVQRVKLSGLLRPDGNQRQVNHLTPRPRWQGSLLAMLHISRLTLCPQIATCCSTNIGRKFNLLALVWLLAETVLAAAAGRTLG